MLWLRQNQTFVLARGEQMCHNLPAECFEDYCNRLARPGMWGDHLALQILAELYRAKIWILSSVGATNFVVEIEPLTPGPAPERHLALAHLYDAQYDSLAATAPAS